MLVTQMREAFILMGSNPGRNEFSAPV